MLADGKQARQGIDDRGFQPAGRADPRKPPSLERGRRVFRTAGCPRAESSRHGSSPRYTQCRFPSSGFQVASRLVPAETAVPRGRGLRIQARRRGREKMPPRASSVVSPAPFDAPWTIPNGAIAGFGGSVWAVAARLPMMNTLTNARLIVAPLNYWGPNRGYRAAFRPASERRSRIQVAARKYEHSDRAEFKAPAPGWVH